MEIRQARYFVAVAELRSFTRAAERLHVVQSAVSAAVAALERELGADLFRRTTREVQLTDAGHAALPEAQRLLSTVESLRDAVAATSGGLRGTLRVGVMHALISAEVAEALAALRRDRPSVDIVLQTHPRGSSGLVAAVAADELDVAIAAPPVRPVEDVVLRRLNVETMVAACATSHPWAQRTSVAVQDLADEPMVDVPQGWASRDVVDRWCAANGVERRVDLQVGDVDAVVSLVRVGLGVAVLAPSSAPSLRGVTTLRLRPAPRFQTSFVLPARRRVKPAAAELVRLTRLPVRVQRHGVT